MIKKINFQLNRNNSPFENSSSSRIQNSYIEINYPLKNIRNCQKISNNHSLNEIKLKPIYKLKNKNY